MLAALALQKPSPPSPAPKLRPIPIILDRGDAAAVVLLHLPAPPRRGVHVPRLREAVGGGAGGGPLPRHRGPPPCRPL